jgi:hypothetical protein
MTTAKTITVERLIAEYAEPLAEAVGINLASSDRTPDGFARLLGDVAGRLSPLDHTRGWLDEAVADLDALVRAEATGEQAQRLLKQVDTALIEAREELALV